MSRLGIASPGGYVSNDPKSKLENALDRIRENSDRAHSRILGALSRVNDGLPAGALIQIQGAQRVIRRALLDLRSAQELHSSRYEIPQDDYAPESEPVAAIPITLRAVLMAAERAARLSDVTAHRAYSAQTECSDDPTESKKKRTVDAMRDLLQRLNASRDALERAYGLLSDNPSASHALKFRRNYVSPPPMYRRVFG